MVAYATTESGMIAGAGNQTGIFRSRVSTLKPLDYSWLPKHVNRYYFSKHNYYTHPSHVAHVAHFAIVFRRYFFRIISY